MFSAKARFPNTYRWNIKQQSEKGGNSEAARVRNTLAVAQDKGVSMSIANLDAKPRRTFEIAQVDKILLHA